MATLLNQLALAKNKDDVRVLHSGEAMGDADHGATPSGALKGGLDKLLTLRIQGAGGLVKKQYVRVADESTGDGDALLLASGERYTTGANVCVVTLGERNNKVVDGCVTACLVKFFVRDSAGVDAKQNIVPQCSYRELDSQHCSRCETMNTTYLGRVWLLGRRGKDGYGSQKH